VLDWQLCFSYVKKWFPSISVSIQDAVSIVNGGGVWWLCRSVTERCEGSNYTDCQNIGEIFIHVHMARVYKLILCIKCQLQNLNIRMAVVRLFDQSAFLLLKNGQLVCELFSDLFLVVYRIPVLCCVVPCRLFICRVSTNDLRHSTNKIRNPNMQTLNNIDSKLWQLQLMSECSDGVSFMTGSQSFSDEMVRNTCANSVFMLPEVSFQQWQFVSCLYPQS